MPDRADQVRDYPCPNSTTVVKAKTERDASISSVLGTKSLTLHIDDPQGTKPGLGNSHMVKVDIEANSERKQ